jgi:uncharacterized OB-fold protein
MTQLPTPEPVVNSETKEYWKSAGEGELRIGECQDCGSVHFYPRRLCPDCFGSNTEYVEAEGTGTIHSYTVVRQAGGDYSEVTPYILGYVELDEGIRILTNIVSTTSDTVEIGATVEVFFDETPNGLALPRFTTLE